MQLSINGQLQTFIDIKDFRAQFDLPPHFGVAYFEPKNYTGLGSIERAGSALNAVRSQMLEAIPQQLSPIQLLPLVDSLSVLFRETLYGINGTVGLREDEVEFAVAGFEDVMQALVYALVGARTSDGRLVDFNAIYFGWFGDSTRVSGRVHIFEHAMKPLHVQVINTAYGRAGLIVDTGDARHYVRDGALACPAEGFMVHLLRDVAARMMAAVGCG
jgi:hypothetical protein